MAKREKEIAKTEPIRIRVITPVEKAVFSRGFYQVEEDCLYVPVYPSGKFFSYVDVEIKRSPLPDEKQKQKSQERSRIAISLDIDNQGHLSFIHIREPRHSWKIDESLEKPYPLETADIRFVSFRTRASHSGIYYNPQRALIKIELVRDTKTIIYALADTVFIGVSSEGILCTVWISDIIDDRAARRMSKWRKSHLTSSLPTSPYTRIEIE